MSRWCPFHAAGGLHPLPTRTRFHTSRGQGGRHVEMARSRDCVHSKENPGQSVLQWLYRSAFAYLSARFRFGSRRSGREARLGGCTEARSAASSGALGALPPESLGTLTVQCDASRDFTTAKTGTSNSRDPTLCRDANSSIGYHARQGRRDGNGRAL